MGLTRRDFLQRSGWAIAVLGLSEAGLVALADRYGQALAQPARRKLALLVGINAYPESVCDFAAKGSALMGCLTDVELQRQLLIHRFGFLPADILTLTDEQATRAAIATAFQTHLIDQAQSGDGVVIHISGLGSQVRSSREPSLVLNTIVPVDGVLPTDEQSPLNDLMVDTLDLLDFFKNKQRWENEKTQVASTNHGSELFQPNFASGTYPSQRGQTNDWSRRTSPMGVMATD